MTAGCFLIYDYIYYTSLQLRGEYEHVLLQTAVAARRGNWLLLFVHTEELRINTIGEMLGSSLQIDPVIMQRLYMT